MALARRGFLFGLFAAPAIVRASNLMPVKLFKPARWPITYNGVEIIFDGGFPADPAMIALLQSRMEAAEIFFHKTMDDYLLTSIYSSGSGLGLSKIL